MNEGLEFVVRAFVIGIGATLVLDLWAMFLKRAFGVASGNFAMLGRWVGHLGRGRFRHASIAAVAPVHGESAIGWLAHYATGIAFAILLLAIMGQEWARQPTLMPALIVGIVTVIAPFFIMQPAMGLGIAASRAPKPNVVRLRSLMVHTVFGVGLYAAALLAAQLEMNA